MTTDYLQRAAATWDSMAKADACYAIMTDPGKQAGGWDLDEFWQTGADDVDRHLAVLSELGWNPSGATALDFGCGIGRLSRALGETYGIERVIGLDFAETMITKARELNPGMEFRVNPGPGIDLPDGSVDLVFTTITLQHIDTELQHGYLREFLRVLRPGGAVFVELAGPPLRAARPGEEPRYADGHEWVMEMWAVDPTAAIRTFRAAGGRILDVRYDRGQSEWSDRWVGWDFYVEKPRD